MSLVECRDVARTFGAGESAVVAVHSATCAVRPEDRIALVGPSGSGKSTLVHLLAGLDRPTAGTISWPGLDNGPDEPGAIGVVFQGPSLMAPLTVLQNVAYPLLLTGGSEADADAAALNALNGLGIGSLASALPEELSGGQAQRVAAARVLAMRPRLILADEPTGQLDTVAANHVVDVLLAAADLLDAGLVIATHDSDIAARLEQRWTMSDGRLRSPTSAVTSRGTT